ncbi:ephrin type-A receptor 1 isoform X1 [Hippopotamus amphibius kiboko]|uniref:ephrin type-A receptor 1 isoform X1 n=1 Tax=Hippopotamus amphibius kiboko TaxID=575201 RepID=UPI002596578E|nr:ephrin type-A receptor 1 isoform X1 [Hippopotamus amphibius kiboko]
MERRWPLGLQLLLLLCAPLPPGARAAEVTLMDTSKAQGELGWLLDPPEDGWSEVQQILNGTPLYMYQDCPVQESRDTDHWLRSNWIYRGEEASRVHVELQFTVRDCKSFPGEAGPLGCKETFNLLYMESDQDVGVQLRRPLFQKVTTVAADQSFTIRDLASGAVKLNVEHCSLGHLTRRGLYLAFHNPGACVALVSVRVFYQRCPETVHGLARFPNTLPGPGGLAEVAGTCLPRAHVIPGPSGAPRMHCSPDGEWLVPVGRCHCEPGYEEGGSGVEGCLACPSGSYRADMDTPSCLKCPQHSTAESEGATVCTCESGHHRTPEEGPHAACTRPPSVPQNLSFSVSGTQLSLRWEPPADLGGREDVRYDVGCSQCRGAVPDGGPCQPCGGSVRFSPGPSGLTTPTVRVDGLEPYTNYTFNVEAQNGVSGLDASKPASASLSISMEHAETLSGLSLRLVKKAPRELELAWAGSRPRSPEGNLSYELQVLNQDEERYQMVLEPRVLLTELQPDTTYIIRVRMVTPLGPGPFSPDHEFRTSPPVSRVLTGGEIVAIVFGLLLGAVLLLGVLLFRSRKARRQRHQRQQRQRDRLADRDREDKLWLKPYVDLQAYEDPAQGALDFTQELDPGWLVVDTVIGEGEFGEVYRGSLRLPSQDSKTVAIKTLKDTSPDGQWWNFLREATIMGQFNHPHILHLEGVVTKRKPIMIITEFMENGALDAFLREREDQLVPGQLVAMLQGIASGMNYLSDHNYVHRDLAARNILVSQNLCCKVSDFGLTRLLDNFDGTYETQGGKIPIRWTAPEAIAHRMFTTASDVWSFGIVMWEVLSFGAKPYGEMSNQEVMKSIEDGYRLPPPLDCPAPLYELMKNCWAYNHARRPPFHRLQAQLEHLHANPHSLRTIANFDPRVTLRLPSLSGSDGIPYRSVPEWLESIRMKRYILHFCSAGLDTMECVLDLTAEDLAQMGITLPGHQKRILCSIQGFKD